MDTVLPFSADITTGITLNSTFACTVATAVDDIGTSLTDLSDLSPLAVGVTFPLSLFGELGVANGLSDLSFDSLLFRGMKRQPP